jgi:hypothetical protein
MTAATARAPVILSPDGIYTTAQVAAWLQHSVDWFYRHRAAYERKHGFPRPVSPNGHPRWSGAALLAWQRTAHEFEAATGKKPTGGNVLDLRTEAMRLEGARRSGAGSKR